MKPVQKFAIDPRYRKANHQAMFDIDRKSLPLGFKVAERGLVYIPPKVVAGNHKHSRQEGFIAFGKGLEIIWLDESGKQHNEPLNPEGPDGQLWLFTVPPDVPHAVRNNDEEAGYLLEFADETQESSKVERMAVVDAPHSPIIKWSEAH